MPLRVATLGMDDRSRAALDLVFRGPGKGAFVVADEASADVTLVDMDGGGAAELWAGYRERLPERPSIVLSVREHAETDALFLLKPLRIADLLQTLQDISTGATERKPTGAQSPAAETVTPSTRPGMAEVSGTHPGGGARRTKAARRATLAIEREAVSRYEQTIPDLPDVDLRDPEDLRKLFFSLDDYAGGRVVREIRAALSDGAAREVAAWNGRIVVLPRTQQILTDLSDTRLKQFALVRLTGLDAPEAGMLPFELRSKALRKKEQVEALEAEAPPGMHRTPIDAFLWKLTAWVARGRIPIGTNPTLPAVLRHWPNLTRLLLLPDAMRIAALWIDQPRSLFNTAKALKIPLAHVLTFYSAAHAIDLITLPKRQVDFLFQPEPVREHRGRGLFARILDQLRGAATAEEAS